MFVTYVLNCCHWSFVEGGGGENENMCFDLGQGYRPSEKWPNSLMRNRTRKRIFVDAIFIFGRK